MTKHSRAERERRAAETIRVKEIEAAWLGSLAPDAAKAFTTAVAAARALPRPAAVGLGAAAAATGVARMYVGAHLPLDIVGGVGLGLALGSAARLAQ